MKTVFSYLIFFLQVDTVTEISGNPFLGGKDSIFWLAELIFSHVSDTPPSESYFPSSVNVFLNESSNLYGGDAFYVLSKPLSLI